MPLPRKSATQRRHRKVRRPPGNDGNVLPARQVALEPSLRWTVEQAAVEFVIHLSQLKARIKKHDVTAGPDGKYSTMDMCIARFGSRELATIRKLELDGDLREARLQTIAAQMIPIKAVQRAWEFALAQLRSTIQGLRLSVEDREALVRTLYDIPLQQYMALGKDAEEKQEADE